MQPTEHSTAAPTGLSGEITAPAAVHQPEAIFRPEQHPGILLLLLLEACSLALYFILRGFAHSEAFSAAVFSHFVVMTSGAILLFSGWRKRQPEALRAGTFIWLGACIFMCFSLNISTPIFAPFANWVNAVVTLLAMSTVAFAWRAQLPRWGLNTLYFSLAVSGWLCVYLALYLLPALPLAVIAVIVLGLGFYLLVPLVFCISIGIKLVRAWAENRQAIVAGLILPPLVALFFIAQRWQVDRQAEKALTGGDGNLPAWVRIAQSLKPSLSTWYYLGGALFYENPGLDGLGFGRSTNQFARQVVHDPFALIAARAIGDHLGGLGTDDRIRALQAIFKNDHDSERRLWSGQDLLSAAQQTNVQVDPALRIARTEQVFEVLNTSQDGQQEAIYTFSLPEGSTVTDLSLWVNGVEEKGHLTTQARAEKAYNAIVGEERRDPSVLHWKEGNMVSVRVFPCTAAEPRRFKLAFVSPLRLQDGHLIYESATFEGPPARLRWQDVRVSGLGAGQAVQLPSGFAREKASGDFTGHTPCNAHWVMRLKAETPQEKQYRLDGKTVRSVALRCANEPFAPLALYLDLNANWTAGRFNTVRKAAGTLPCYVWSGQDWIKLDDENGPEMFRLLSGQAFSLFPFHRLPHPATALVVTQNNGYAPRLADLRGSAFGDDLYRFCQGVAVPRVFVLGQLESPYLRALRESGVLQTASGDPKQLDEMLRNRVFPVPVLGPDDFCIETSGLTLQAIPADPGAPPAPDNLTRLVAYQDLMRRMGRQYFQLGRPEVQEEWLDAARTAAVVSPVSSLVVLETREDYARFDIDKPGQAAGTLPKLAQSQSGSVPEPREWALLILALSFMLLLWWKKW